MLYLLPDTSFFAHEVSAGCTSVAITRRNRPDSSTDPGLLCSHIEWPRAI